MFNVLLKVACCPLPPQICISGTRATWFEPRCFIGVPTPGTLLSPAARPPRTPSGSGGGGPAHARNLQQTPTDPPALDASPRVSFI